MLFVLLRCAETELAKLLHELYNDWQNEQSVFVLMLQSVSSVIMFLCFLYCLNVVLPLSYSVL